MEVLYQLSLDITNLLNISRLFGYCRSVTLIIIRYHIIFEQLWYPAFDKIGFANIKSINHNTFEKRKLIKKNYAIITVVFYLLHLNL